MDEPPQKQRIGGSWAVLGVGWSLALLLARHSLMPELPLATPSSCSVAIGFLESFSKVDFCSEGRHSCLFQNAVSMPGCGNQMFLL